MNREIIVQIHFKVARGISNYESPCLLLANTRVYTSIFTFSLLKIIIYKIEETFE